MGDLCRYAAFLAGSQRVWEVARKAARQKEDQVEALLVGLVAWAFGQPQVCRPANALALFRRHGCFGEFETDAAFHLDECEPLRRDGMLFVKGMQQCGLLIRRRQRLCS